MDALFLPNMDDLKRRQMCAVFAEYYEGEPVCFITSAYWLNRIADAISVGLERVDPDEDFLCPGDYVDEAMSEALIPGRVYVEFSSMDDEMFPDSDDWYRFDRDIRAHLYCIDV